FGEFDGRRGVLHQAARREGWMNAILLDKGVIHHLVVGDRADALHTMKESIERLKMVVRGIGSLFNVIGWLFLFSAVTRFLMYIPLVGPLLSRGFGLIGVFLGILLSLVTILVAYVTSHPLVLIAILATVVGLAVLLRRRADQSQRKVKGTLEHEVGHPLSPIQLKEMEFMELVHLSQADGDRDIKEIHFLQEWGDRQGWDEEKVSRLMQEAKAKSSGTIDQAGMRDHLHQLIRLALADGNLEEQELRNIRKAAKEAGIPPTEVSEAIASVLAAT
ncbi:MAG: TMEM43 family protein, partial [Verrucomicrobiota bacterium]